MSNSLKLKEATIKELISLKAGRNILVDHTEELPIIAIFLKYEDEKIICYDSSLEDSMTGEILLNEAEYDSCIILPEVKQIVQNFELEQLDRV